MTHHPYSSFKDTRARSYDRDIKQHSSGTLELLSDGRLIFTDTITRVSEEVDVRNMDVFVVRPNHFFVLRDERTVKRYQTSSDPAILYDRLRSREKRDVRWDEINTYNTIRRSSRVAASPYDSDQLTGGLGVARYGLGGSSYQGVAGSSGSAAGRRFGPSSTSVSASASASASALPNADLRARQSPGRRTARGSSTGASRPQRNSGTHSRPTPGPAPSSTPQTTPFHGMGHAASSSSSTPSSASFSPAPASPASPRIAFGSGLPLTDVCESDMQPGYYEEEGKVAEGGQGSIVLCRAKRNGVQFVRKEIRCSSEREAEQANHWALTFMYNVKHKNIIEYKMVQQERTSVYIFMPYFPEKDLKSLLKSDKPIPARQVVSISLQISDALKFLHSLNPVSIVHRDIKPDNILLADNGTRCVLTDFDSMGLTSRKNSTETTFEYRAPEKELEAPADIWSLGVVLFMLCTRQDPILYNPDRGQEMMFNCSEWDQRSLSEQVHNAIVDRAGAYPPELVQLVVSMLSLRQNARPNIYDVYRDLKRLNDYM